MGFRRISSNKKSVMARIIKSKNKRLTNRTQVKLSTGSNHEGRTPRKTKG